MNTYLVGVCNAYELKTGGYRGVFLRSSDKERFASVELFETLEQARFWSKAKAWELFPDKAIFAPVRRHGEYLANVWIRG